MGLQSTIQNAVKSIFTAMGDVAKTATYTINPNSSYNPVTGAVTTTGSTQTLSVIRDEYKTNEIDGESILATDVKFLCPYNDFTGTPTTKDTIQVDGIVYNIVGHPERDPADAMYVFHARQ